MIACLVDEVKSDNSWELLPRPTPFILSSLLK